MRHIFATLMLAIPAHAQAPQCAPLPDALTALERGYQEAPRMQGLTAAGVLMIVTAAEGGGFSVLLVSPDGQACMVASGSGFEVLETVKPGIDG